MSSNFTWSSKIIDISLLDDGNFDNSSNLLLKLLGLILSKSKFKIWTLSSIEKASVYSLSSSPIKPIFLLFDIKFNLNSKILSWSISYL